MTGWPQRVAGGDGRPAEHRQRGVAKLQGPRRSRRCRRSSAWPSRPSTCPGPIRARPASSAPTYAAVQADGPDMAEHDAQRGQQGSPAPTARSCSRASTTLHATSTPAARCKGADAHTERAFGVLTSSKLVEALDLSKESPQGARALRRRQAVQVPVRRRADGERPAADGPAAGRGRRARRDAELRPLGQPRQELRPGPRPRRQARPVPDGAGRRPGRSRACSTT